MWSLFVKFCEPFFFLFKIPVLQTNNGPSLTGLTTIAAHLVKQANKEYLLGSTAEEKAIVQQWLEYRVTQIDGHSSKKDIHTLLKVSWPLLQAEMHELFIRNLFPLRLKSCSCWLSSPLSFCLSSLHLLFPLPGTDSVLPPPRPPPQISAEVAALETFLTTSLSAG